jgi:hypothetical protein
VKDRATEKTINIRKHLLTHVLILSSSGRKASELAVARLMACLPANYGSIPAQYAPRIVTTAGIV